MKCWVLWLNRNRAKLHKKASYEASVGKVHKKFRENVGFFIPEESIPMEVELRRGTIPLWIVNAKTGMALGMEFKSEGNPTSLKLEGDPAKDVISMKEKTDVDAHTKLNLLSKKEFWKQVAEKIKLSKMETFVYLCAGYGLIRMIEYFLMLVFTPH
jgi:hypothetical protein